MGVQNPKNISLPWVKRPDGWVDGNYIPARFNTLTMNIGGKVRDDVYFETFENIPLGNITTDIGKLKQRIMGGGSIANEGLYQGSKCWRQNYAVNDLPELYYRHAVPTERAYHSCHFTFSGAITGNSCSWKFGRIGTSDEPYHPNRYAHMYTSQGHQRPHVSAPDLTVDIDQVKEYSETNDVVDHPEYFTQGVWHFYEMECYAGTVGGNDSVFVVRIDGKKVLQFTGSSMRTNTNPDLIKWTMTFLTGMQNPTTNNMIFLMDNPYFDASRGRVVMTNNAVYENSTQFAIQPTYNWNLKQFIKNGAGFLIGQQGFVHVFDDNGNYCGVDKVVSVDTTYARSASVEV